MTKVNREFHQKNTPNMFHAHPNSMLARIRREKGEAAARALTRAKNTYEENARQYENSMIRSRGW